MATTTISVHPPATGAPLSPPALRPLMPPPPPHTHHTGAPTHKVPLSLYKVNRERLVAKLMAQGESVPDNALVLLQVQTSPYPHVDAASPSPHSRTPTGRPERDEARHGPRAAVQAGELLPLGVRRDRARLLWRHRSCPQSVPPLRAQAAARLRCVVGTCREPPPFAAC